MGAVILGQFWVLHVLESEEAPEQLAPPCCGDGFVQERVLTEVPPPQLTEQDPQEPQLL